jgi:hypothetical protein
MDRTVVRAIGVHEGPPVSVMTSMMIGGQLKSCRFFIVRNSITGMRTAPVSARHQPIAFKSTLSASVYTVLIFKSIIGLCLKPFSLFSTTPFLLLQHSLSVPQGQDKGKWCSVNPQCISHARSRIAIFAPAPSTTAATALVPVRIKYSNAGFWLKQWQGGLFSTLGKRSASKSPRMITTNDGADNDSISCPWNVQVSPFVSSLLPGLGLKFFFNIFFLRPHNVHLHALLR